MAIELVSCPACGTKNAAYRFACVKCGVELFDPTGADLPISNASEQKEVTPPSSPPPQPQAAADQPPQALPSADPFLQEVVSEKQRVDRQVETAAQEHEEHERQAEKRLSEAHRVARRLEDFARNKELDKALIALWEKVKHYPSWSQREDFGKSNKLELADVVGSRKENVESVEFTYAGQRFMLSARHDHDIVGDPCVQLSFYEDGTEVFTIRCREHDDRYGIGITDYLCDDVSAFKKRGSWAKVLLRIYGQIQIADKKCSADAKELVAKHIKSRFEE